MGKTIGVGLDAGYDGIKIVLENGYKFWSPSEILSERLHPFPASLQTKEQRNGVIMYGDDNERFAIGELASEIKQGYHSATDMDDLHIENETRFLNPNFKRLCLACIYQALEASGETVDEDLKIELCIAVPHDYQKLVSRELRATFSGRQMVSIQYGNNEVQEAALLFTKVAVGSQVIFEFIGYAGDDEGYITELKDESYPVLLLDLGYGTSGKAVIEKGLFVSKAVSDKTYTMMKANEAAAAYISELSGMTCTHQMIEQAARSGSTRDAEFKYEKGSEYVSVNMLEVQQKKINEVVEGLYLTTKKEFDLPYIRNIIISGGSGMRFYQELVKKYTDTKLLEPENVIIANCLYKANDYDPLYAVAVGCIKQLVGAREE